MRHKKFYFATLILVAIILASSTLLPSQKSLNFSLVTKQKSFVAGTDIRLSFENKSNSKAQLFIIHSYGKTLLDGEISNGKLDFWIPKIYTQKTGKLNWFLISEEQTLQKGAFEINPNDQTKTQIENYLGPPSTLVGDGHFVMYVTIPTDGFDNPLPENSMVSFRSQFLNSMTNEQVLTKDFIAWKNFYAPTQSGLLLVSAASNGTITKEYDAVIFPGIATNFRISFSRNHQYADGNQMTTLQTNVLKDKFGNTVSDGTLVSFIITTKDNIILKSFGTTIGGVASTKILHPDHPDDYIVNAFVAGISQSNTVVVHYNAINPKIDFEFSKDNRIITVGPLRSFMNQLVPDGIKVNLKIYHNHKLIETLQEDSFKGQARFFIPADYYKEKNYSFEIITLGSTQKIQEKNYDNHQ